MCTFTYTQINTYICTFYMCEYYKLPALVVWQWIRRCRLFPAPFIHCSRRQYYPEQHEAVLSPISRGHKLAQNQLWKIMQQNIGVKPLGEVFKQRLNCSGGLLKLSPVWKSLPRPASSADLQGTCEKGQPHMVTASNNCHLSYKGQRRH